MWIQVRSFDGKKLIQLDNLSKLTKIEDVRSRLVDEFDAPTERQRLFYRGKQLEDGHTLFDYDVGLNDLVQIMVRATVPQPVQTKEEPAVNGYNSSGEESSYSDKENKKPETPKKEEKPSSSLSQLDLPSTYKIGDIIDGRDLSVGAWFEAKIIKIVPNSDSSTMNIDNKNAKTVKLSESDSASVNSENNNNKMDIDNEKPSSENKNSDTENLEKKTVIENVIEDDDGFTYHVVFDGYDETEPEKLQCKDIRPRAKTIIKFSDVKIGQKAMINYNVDDPDLRGFWYDCIITGKRDTRTIKELTGTVFIGPDLMPLDDCKLLFVYEVFEIEKPGSQINAEDVAKDPAVSPVKRTNKPECDYCKDDQRKKCKHCACSVCGGKNDPDKQILCDECDQAYHLACLNPPLETLPEEDEWYCPRCKTDDSQIVRAGEKLKESKKKAKMASAQGSTSRDWGRGMACVGRQKVCSVVPPNHFGPIPGVEVGTLWKFRVQVSEAGVHRPHVAGIHGRDSDGAYSIVLSGGYEDDKDNGNEFWYTGSGGRDLSGNKRTAEQSCDQKLTRMNRALAKNCNAPLSEKGAVAADWRGGKPLRVVRNCKGRKHSDYAPEEGNRYDGIYKVIKYWPEKGKSGFIVWRYLMRRDDPVPAPWTKEGKKRAAQLGLEMQYPDGYLEAQAKKEEESEEKNTPAGKKRKRQKDDSDSSPNGTPEKKQKIVAYKISSPVRKLIKEDSANIKLWDEALDHTKQGGKIFLQKIEELFTCICCQDIVFKPVTTQCNHNICKTCLVRSIKAEVFSCPMCRTDLGKDQKTAINKPLQDILQRLFPGYENGR